MGALTVTQNTFPTAQEFQTMKEVGAMAIRSGFLPSSINTPEKAVIIMLKGRELGIPPMQAFSSIAVVNGKPTMSAELMVSMIYRNVPGAVIDYIETDEKQCVIEAKRPGGKPTQFKFSIEDAKRANLLGKGPWQSYPAAMLRARCVSAMARAMFPDALSGVVYTPEELGAQVDHDGNVIDTIQDARRVDEHESIDEPKDEIRNHAPQSKAEAAFLNRSGISIDDLGDMVCTFGKKLKGQAIRDIHPDQLRGYVQWLEQASAKQNKALEGDVKEFVLAAKKWLELRGPE